jgi:tight adherence protein B
MSAVQRGLQSGQELTYTSRPNVTSLDVVVSAAGLSATARTVPGAVSAGNESAPATVHLTKAPGPLSSHAGIVLLALLALVAAGLFAYAVISLIFTERSRLETVLEQYDETQPGAIAHEGEGPTSLVRGAFMARAVEATGRIAKERGILDRVESMLDRADIALRPAELLFFYVVAVVAVTILLGVFAGPLLGLLGFLVIALVPPAVLAFMANLRLKKFNSQLPDTLQLLAGSLRAGFSFQQGVEAVAQETNSPMKDELQRVIVESRLGRPLEEALDDCAARMSSEDFSWAVMAVRIQREVGGNLAELLSTVQETMVERERLRRDVRALTAEGRMSAIVLGIMPPALGVIFYLTNPSYMKVLFNHVGGQIAVGITAVIMVFGFFWMSRIVNIEV